MTPPLAMAFHVLLLVSAILAAVAAQKLNVNTRSFDSSEWIPLAQPCPTCRSQTVGAVDDQVPQKSSRVLNVVPFQRNLFPGGQQPNFREIVFQQPPPPLNNHNHAPEAQKLQGPPPTFAQNNGRIFPDIPHNSPLVQIPSHNAPLIHNSHDSLTPQFLPHLQDANFNGNLQPPQLYGQTAQAFIPPANQQIPQAQFISQPHDDFQLLQQLLSNQNVKFADLFDGNQTQVKQIFFPDVQAEPIKTTAKPIQRPTEQPKYVSSTTTQTPKSPAKEEVQLLYVPLETLRQRGTTKSKPEPVTEKIFRNFEYPVTELYQPQLKKQSQLQTIQQDFAQQSLHAQKLQQQLQQKFKPTEIIPKITSTPSPNKKKSKLKPHQPPLAVFMGSNGDTNVKVDDVLSVLKHARTISVLDQVTPDMPKVFVGPSNLQPPNGYAKFELPYLSNLDGNRIQRKVEQFPFFVAPLSYTAPDGYAKIPFPAPHIGSVVIKEMKDVPEKPEIIPYNIYPTNYNQFSDNSRFNDKTRSRRPQIQSASTTIKTPSIHNTNTQYLSTPDFANLNSFIAPQQYETGRFVSSTAPPEPSEIKQYSIASPKPEIAVTTPAQYTGDGHFITNPAYVKSTQNYQTSPKPNVNVNYGPSSTSDYKYTVLEQFPIRHEVTTQTLIKNMKEAEKASTKAYADFNFDHYRTHPVGINDEFVNVRKQHRRPQQPQPQVEHTVSSTIRPTQRQPLVTVTPLHVRPLFNEPQPQQPQQSQQQFSPTPNIEQTVQHISKQSTISTTEQIPYISSTIQPQSSPYQQQSTPDANIYNQPIPQYQYPELTQPQIYATDVNKQPTYFNTPANNQQYKSTPEPPPPPPTYQQVYSEAGPSTKLKDQPQYTASEVYVQSPGDSQYNLPAQLPPINPNLPGLINSLQDELQYQSSQSTMGPDPSEATMSYHSTTEEPSTTLNSRGRQTISRGRTRAQSTRASSSVTSTTTVSPNRARNTSRRRRPYNGRPRPEYEKYLYNGQKDKSTDTIVSTTTEKPIEITPAIETVVDLTTPKLLRSRYTYQTEPAQVQSTEPPKRPVHNTRTRFRTRGRQPQKVGSTSTTTTTEAPLPSAPGEYMNGHQNNAPMTERSSLLYTPTNLPAFQPPQLEGGFHVSPPFATQENPNFHQYEQPYIPEQRPVYQHQQQAAPEYAGQIYKTVNAQIQPNGYSQEHEEKYSTSISPISEPPSASLQADGEQTQYLIETTQHKPDYKQNDVPVSHSEPEIISKPISGQPEYVRFNTGTQHTSILQHADTTTTTKRTPVVRTKGRPHTRGRTRNYFSTPEPSSTTPANTTTTKKIVAQENPDEFYGFIRMPNYQEQEYRQDTSPKYMEGLYGTQPPQYFSPTERISTVSDEIYVENVDHASPTPVYAQYAEPIEQNRQQPIYSTSEEVISSNEEVTTRRQFLHKTQGNRFVRPTSIPYTTSTKSSGGKYTIRTTKRPDLESPKITKIRGRIRKPTVPTTTTTTDSTVEQADYESYNTQTNYIPRRPSFIQQQHAAVNELAHMDEPVPQQRVKYPSRGRVHFKDPDSAAEDTSGILERENYPVAYLDAQEPPRTRKPEFRITVAPSDPEYDQVPYSSIYRPRVISQSPEDGGAESQWSNKYATLYRTNTTNEIPSSDKPEPVESVTEITLENTNTTTGENKSIFEQIFEEMAKFGMAETETTTESATTTEESVGEIKVMKGKKRGFWKRVRVRPVDVLETAESQYIGSAASNNLISESAKKSYPRPTVEQYTITFEPEENSTATSTNDTVSEPEEVVTVLPEITTEYINENDPITEQPIITTSPEVLLKESQKPDYGHGPGIFQSLFEMFDNTSEAPEINPKVAEIEQKSEIIQVPTTIDSLDVGETTTYTPLTTMINDDLSTENQLNETKIINDKIKMYTERLENLTEKPSGEDNSHPLVIDASSPLIIGTSTSTEISHETEICYRGRCVKSNTTEITNDQIPLN